MHDVMRKRIIRKLEALPDERLYQVLDYLDFLESKYAPGRAPAPSGFQRFAERFEDEMRARTLTPRVIGGAMELVGTAGRVLGEIADAGRELVSGVKPRPVADRPAAKDAWAGVGVSREGPRGGSGSGEASSGQPGSGEVGRADSGSREAGHGDPGTAEPGAAHGSSGARQ